MTCVPQACNWDVSLTTCDKKGVTRHSFIYKIGGFHKSLKHEIYNALGLFSFHIYLNFSFTT